jgi:hypothetical protein
VDIGLLILFFSPVDNSLIPCGFTLFSVPFFCGQLNRENTRTLFMHSLWIIKLTGCL